MRFFSRLVFVCNLCFIVAVIFRFVELGKRTKGNYESLIPLPALQNTIVVLGYSAIFINLIFFIAALLFMAKGKIQTIPRWLFLVNLILLPTQIWYFFFSNF